MKKLTLLLVMLLAGASLNALYNASPAEPEAIDEGFFLSKSNFAALKVGFQRDYVADRRLKALDGATGIINRFEAIMDQGVVTLNLEDRYEIFGSVGSMRADFSNHPAVDHQIRSYHTNNNFLVGAGARAIAFRWRSTDLGINGTYQYSRPTIRTYELDGVTIPSGNSHLNYQEWQFGIGVSHHIDFFTPYLNLNYSAVLARVQHLPAALLATRYFKMHSREHIGLAFGCALSTGKLFDLTVEAGVISEEYLTLAGNLKF